MRKVPKRIQRKRTKGWRMPANTVYVGRSTKWGNPYYVKAVYAGKRHGYFYEVFDNRDNCTEGDFFERGDAANWAVAKYHESLIQRRLPISLDDIVKELKGKNLACWCPLDHSCHADVLLEIANR